MAQQLLLVNPRKRRKSPARRAKARRSVRRSNPIASNPAPRRRRARRQSNPVSAVRSSMRRRYRRNPIKLSGNVGAMLQQGAMQGVGAVGVDAIMGFVGPVLPQALTSNYYAYQATKAGLAVALGTFGRPLLKGFARQAAVGSLTCIVHETVRSLVAGTVPLGRVGYVSSGPITGRRSGVGKYMAPGPNVAPSLAGVGKYMEPTQGKRNPLAGYVPNK